VQDYLARGIAGSACRVIHPESTAENPLPRNVAAIEQLPDDRGWWGYSFRDVPSRRSGETVIATIPDCRVVWYRDSAKACDFYPAIVTGSGTALDMRELRFRPAHAAALRQRPARIARATWIIERVYHNHSHWLTAHLPKLLLLRELGELDGVVLPRERTPVIDGSLHAIGLSPDDFRQFEPDQFLQVDELVVVATDRFRPELLRRVPEAFGVATDAAGGGRVFVSRARASRRRLLNEEAVWPLLREAGFERVCLEELSFAEQVALMRRTAVMVAPHGAGLTNMLFCPPGAHVVEIADLSFPNPNFYALASALNHHYWLVAGEGLGECHPLEKDLRVAPGRLQEVLAGLGV
jgi:capsular polysaccharide biosynthesis protein